MPSAVQEALNEIGTIRRWQDGQVLAWGGQVANSAFVVMKGRVRMSTVGEDGEEQILEWLEPGEIGALASVLASVAFPFDFIADGPIEVMHLERGRLCALLEHNAPTALAIARVLSIRFCFLTEMHVIDSFGTMAERVWATLIRMTRRETVHANKRPIVLSITQAELAHAVGASRFRVALELKRLEAAGRIELSRGEIAVLDEA